MIGWVVHRGEFAIRFVNAERLPDIIELLGLSAVNENFLDALGAVGRWQKPARRANFHADHAWRLGKGMHGNALMDFLHDVVPDRGGAHYAANVLHLGIVRIADPDANRIIGRVANRPVVAPVRCCAGLDRRRPRQFEDTVRTKPGRARRVIREDIAH